MAVEDFLSFKLYLDAKTFQIVDQTTGQNFLVQGTQQEVLDAIQGNKYGLKSYLRHSLLQYNTTYARVTSLETKLLRFARPHYFHFLVLLFQIQYKMIKI